MSKLLSAKSSRGLPRLMLTLLFSMPLLSFAQLAPPNNEGISMGHLHLLTSDIEASQEFWEKMGAGIVQNGPISMYGIPGVLIMLREAEPTSGSDGTMIIHVGFHVPNVNAAYNRWASTGTDVERGEFDQQIWVNGPDGLRIEILENEDIAVPIQMHHIHWNTPDIEAMQTWYYEMFGAVPGYARNFPSRRHSWCQSYF